MTARMMIAFTCAFGISVSSLPVCAQSTYVTGSIPGTLVNIEPDTVREQPADSGLRPFPVRQAWFKSVEFVTEERWTKRTKQLISVSCEMGKIAVLSSVEYLPNDRMGDSFDTDDHAQNYDYAVPGSVGYRMLITLCGN